MHAATIAFEPELEPRRSRRCGSTATWCGDWCKVVAVYESSFWRAQGHSGILHTDGPIQVWWDGGQNALVGLAVGPATARLATLDETQLQGLVVSTLGPAFGADARAKLKSCLLYTSPSPRDATLSRMPSSA